MPAPLTTTVFALAFLLALLGADMPAFIAGMCAVFWEVVVAFEAGRSETPPS